VQKIHLKNDNMCSYKIRGLWGLVSLIALDFLVLAAGCNTARISDINNDPARYMERDVTIAGRVLNSFGVANQGAFELDDGTGRLWVWSSGFGVPGQGARVIVTGRVQAGVAIGGRFFANVLRETQPLKTT
jgi:hypothetical protein